MTNIRKIVSQAVLSAAVLGAALTVVPVSANAGVIASSGHAAKLPGVGITVKHGHRGSGSIHVGLHL